MLKRNPFPMVGKVIKYELKNTYLPMLIAIGVVIVVSLLNKFAGMPTFFAENYSENHSIQSMVISVLIAVMNGICISGLLIFALCIFASRFKRTMIGDDAYVTMTLPVTTFEHLFGRFVTGLLWSCVCLVTIVLSVWIFMSDAFRNIEATYDFNFNDLSASDIEMLYNGIGFTILTYFVLTVWVISCVFVLNGVKNINKGLSGLLIAAMIIFYIFFGQIGFVNTIDGSSSGEYLKILRNYNLHCNLPYLGLAVLNYAVAHLIFARNLNIK